MCNWLYSLIFWSDMCMHLTNYAINKHSENFDPDHQKGSKRREFILSSQASWLAEVERHEERHAGGFYRIYPHGNDHKYSQFLHQGSSYCQETVTSKAHEEYARRMVQNQQDKDMAARPWSPGKRWSRSEGRGQQGESLGEQSRKSSGDLQGDEKPVRRQPSSLGPRDWAFTGRANQSGSSNCTVWDSYETRLISEVEELARQRSLAQRDILVRKLGLVNAIQSLLRPRTYHCIPAQTHHPVSQEPSLQLQEHSFMNTKIQTSSPRHTVTR
ncbi:tubulin polyglutamylase TTLL13-like [Alosa pseudoharengus]|uniref:tubulin polyglutamylase TTLL13-like n=1 Tax=Alosa pseudoharengus TaxID=34774 RepID=UPI003F8B4743